MHALVHSLFRPTDEAETRALFQSTADLFEQHGLLAQGGREALITRFAEETAAEFGIAPRDHRFAAIERFVRRLFDYESFFVLPAIDWSERRSTSAWWELREALNVQKALAADFDEHVYLIRCALTELVRPVIDAVPAYLSDRATGSDLSVPTNLIHSLGDTGAVFDEVLATAFAKDLKEHALFTRLSAQVERNLIAASGGNPHDPRGFTRLAITPSKSSIRDPAKLAETYLSATPLLEFLDQDIDFVIPESVRFEHAHIVAGSGHGKSQTLQYLICRDLEAVARGQRSIIVLDSQGDLIRNIAHLKEFAAGGPLHDRLVLIDPSDVEWPVSLNLFDVGIERLQAYEPLERERLTNSILELYDFVLGSLLSAEMTQKQNVIFRYVTRLMLHIPDATIHTLRELMEPDSHLTFALHIEKLSGTARRFFETEFRDKEFAGTKKQVLRRLWGILENQTFERMFSHPRSKLDLFAEMNAGKVVLINTAKDLLKEQGSEIFGRFFIALIAQAAQERATLPERKRLPTFVYIDEAADYFDRNIGVILAQARKYKVGMVLAHQFLGQLQPALQDAFAANTSIKLAGGVSNKDARALAAMLHCEPECIETQAKGSFAAQVRGLTKAAVPLQFPLGFLERKAKMSAADWMALQSAMRKRYAVHYSELETAENEREAPADAPTAPASKSRNAAKPHKSSDDIDIEPGPEW
ncbi:MAG: type IV secretory system conjugative DNA transfer family protein [Pseudomonadota bacterium]